MRNIPQYYCSGCRPLKTRYSEHAAVVSEHLCSVGYYFGEDACFVVVALTDAVLWAVDEHVLLY